MPNNSEKRLFIDPINQYESVQTAERLKVVTDFLKRDNLATLSPLETHIIEQAIGNFLKNGKIGTYGVLNANAHSYPPERIYMDDEDEQKDDVRRTMLQLEARGILIFNKESGEYTFGMQPTPQAASK
jgi:hypothetical protein